MIDKRTYTDENIQRIVVTYKVPHTHIIEIGNKIDRKKGARPYAH